jgi:phosphatidylserine decarboxylase
MPLNRNGLREMLILTVVLGAAAAGAAALARWTIGPSSSLAILWAAAAPFAVLWVAGLAFFRDPPRRIPTGAGILVAPADGVVTEIHDLEYDERIGGAATRIGIFLSVLDVHVNRSPCAGRVVRVDYAPGEFLDARHPESGARNESNTLLIEPEHGVPGPVIVRQVAGLIARRIVCTARPGDRLERGQRIGLIKFGSRTEIIVPAVALRDLRVAVSQQVYGGSSVLIQHGTTRSPSEVIQADVVPAKVVPAKIGSNHVIPRSAATRNPAANEACAAQGPDSSSRWSSE